MTDQNTRSTRDLLVELSELAKKIQDYQIQNPPTFHFVRASNDADPELCSICGEKECGHLSTEWGKQHNKNKHRFMDNRDNYVKESADQITFDCKVWQCQKCGRTQTTNGADYLAGKCRDCDPPVMPPRDPHVCTGKDYCIHVCKWGIAISGGVPVSELKGISEKYGMGKTAVASMRIAHTLGMALVFCKDANAEQEWWDMILFMNNLKDRPYPTPSNAGV